jgi:translation initiation factor 2 subunit 1
LVKCEERYNKAKAVSFKSLLILQVHSIMRHVADSLHMELEELYVKVGWPLYRKFGHAYDAFKTALV